MSWTPSGIFVDGEILFGPMYFFEGLPHFAGPGEKVKVGTFDGSADIVGIDTSIVCKSTNSVDGRDFHAIPFWDIEFGAQWDSISVHGQRAQGTKGIAEGSGSPRVLVFVEYTVADDATCGTAAATTARFGVIDNATIFEAATAFDTG
jgi:hypothetical protein